MKKLIVLLVLVFSLLFVTSVSATAVPETIYCGSKTSSFNLNIAEFNDDSIEELNSQVYGDSLNEGIITQVDGDYIITFLVNSIGNSTIIINDNDGNQFLRNINVIEVTTVKIIKSEEDTFTLSANGYTNLVGIVNWELNGESKESNNIITTNEKRVKATYDGVSDTYSILDFGNYGEIIINTVGIILLIIILFIFAKSLFTRNIYLRMKKDVVKNHKLITDIKGKISKINKKLPKEIAQGIILALTLDNNAALIKTNLPNDCSNLVSYTNSLNKLYKALNELVDNLSDDHLIKILDYIDSFNDKIVFELEKLEKHQTRNNELQKSLDEKKKNDKKNKKSKNGLKNIRSEEEIEALIYIKSLNILK